MTAPILFLDCETTSLDPHPLSVWEVAWCIGDGPITSRQLAVDLDDPRVEPEALEVGRFADRYRPDRTIDRDELARQLAVDVRHASRNTLNRVERVRVAGSAPWFDVAHLSANGVELDPVDAHHRLVDVPALVAGLVGTFHALSLDGSAAALDVPPVHPDRRHTAAGDVELTRRVYRAWRQAVDA